MNYKTHAPQQTIYGSLSRYQWIKSFLNKNQKIVDLGCGTGSMITIPLIEDGFDVLGVDLDEKSIKYGQNLLLKKNINLHRLQCCDFRELNFSPDVVILSEVLEHIDNLQLNSLLQDIFEKISLGGIVLITVPNGYGAFELESFIWNKLKVGRVLEWLRLDVCYIIFKNKLLGYNTILNVPSSLDSSPHVQRFTYYSLPRILKKFRFKVISKRGGSLISGPFSNLFFTGFKNIMKLNMILGNFIPWFASDFYIAVKKEK